MNLGGHPHLFVSLELSFFFTSYTLLPNMFLNSLARPSASAARQIATFTLRSNPVQTRIQALVCTLTNPPLRTFTSTAKLSAETRPKNDDIPFETVQLVSSTDNTLGPPEPLRDILSRFSTKTHTISLVSSHPPIVRVHAKAEIQKADRAAKDKAKARRKTKQETSELQVTWESAQGDLQHKLNQAKQILSHGDRLDLVFTSRAKNASPAPQYEGKKLKRAQEMILGLFTSELEGIASKRKEDVVGGVGGSMVTMYYEPHSDLRQQALEKAEELAEQKASEKQARKEERRIKEEERRRKAQLEEEERRRKLGIL
ncbi:hypothetical protein QFC22_002838 [Naganishia vaughanmartiniae]|uniref:Uncharacterized protein n=1 Tax=Naganishia vaughanmartiniae TaxID=1424756 RepID=A0ACC2XB87_9TREE|nr:hypothetical protein QFC22_002838 [Naganishia vaughanmartiniae]